MEETPPFRYILIRGMMKMERLLFFRILLMIAFVVPLTACGEAIDTNMSESMVDFEFTTQDEETLRLDDLKGDWWITYMSYTECKTICPRTTANMVSIQEALKEVDLHPHIISFSIDPDNDHPEVLREYAEEFGADLRSWDFLTGYDFESIKEISEDIFHAALEKGAVEQISHSYMIYLVNPDGQVIKKYNGMSSEALDELIDDVKTVL